MSGVLPPLAPALRARRLAALGLALAPLLALAGCASHRGPVLPPPQRFPGYPTQAQSENVWAEAVLYTNHEDVFDTDVVRRGIVPVELKVGMRGVGEITQRLTADSFDPHLYLQDGTVLTWARPEEIEGVGARGAERMQALGIHPSLLSDWDRAEPGFLYFRFDPERVQVKGTRVLSKQDVDRELDLQQSLLGFSVATESGPRTIYVGLRAGRWTR